MFAKTWSKLFVSTASTALITLGIGTLSANAIEFSFTGNRIKGSYKVDDQTYNAWLSQASNPIYAANGFAFSSFLAMGRITDFKLFLDGQEINYNSNLNISEILGIHFDSIHNPVAEHYDYWGITVYKGLEGQQASPGEMRTGLWGMLDIWIENEGGNIRDCLSPGQLCSGTVSLQDPALNENVAEQITHYLVTGSSQSVPVLPTQQNGNQFIFNNAPSNAWIDPPTADGFLFEMTGNSLFTEILDFPTNIDADNLFNVFVGDNLLGQFSPGQNVDFVSLLGTGVSQFKVTGISPFDPQNPLAFPIKLEFNTATADFTMTPLVESQNNTKSVPEPTSGLALLLLGGIAALSVKPRFNIMSGSISK